MKIERPLSLNHAVSLAITNVIIANSPAKTIVNFAKNPSNPFVLPPKIASAPPEIAPPMPELLLDCKTTEAINAIQIIPSSTINVVIKTPEPPLIT